MRLLYDSGWVRKRWQGSRRSRLARRTIVGNKSSRMVSLRGIWRSNFVFQATQKEKPDLATPVRRATETHSEYMKGTLKDHSRRQELLIDVIGIGKKIP